MPICFHEGVVKGRIDLQQFVALTSTNAARLFGIYPQKGTIAIGADADIVVWDAEKKVRIPQSILHHDHDYTPYEEIGRASGRERGCRYVEVQVVAVTFKKQ